MLKALILYYNTVVLASVSRPSPNSLYNEKCNCGGKKEKKKVGGKKK